MYKLILSATAALICLGTLAGQANAGSTHIVLTNQTPHTLTLTYSLPSGQGHQYGKLPIFIIRQNTH